MTHLNKMNKSNKLNKYHTNMKTGMSSLAEHCYNCRKLWCGRKVFC